MEKWTLDSDDRPFTPHLKNTELDLATIYMSTILHFRLEIDNQEIVTAEEEPTQTLLDESNYNRSSHKIHVGDIKQELPLAEIDFAGPGFSQFDTN